MLPRDWKAGRRERRACRAIGKRLDGTVKAAAAGLRMIEEEQARAGLLAAADALEAGLGRREGDDAATEGAHDPPAPGIRARRHDDATEEDDPPRGEVPLVR